MLNSPRETAAAAAAAAAAVAGKMDDPPYIYNLDCKGGEGNGKDINQIVHEEAKNKEGKRIWRKSKLDEDKKLFMKKKSFFKKMFF